MQPFLQWKSTNVTYSEGVFVALGIQHAMRMRDFVICGLSGLYSVFPHYPTNCTIFDKKLLSIKYVCFDFL